MFKTQAISFNEMGFSELWQDYLKWSPKVHPFFEYQPHNDAHLAAKAALVTANFATDRKDLVEAIKGYCQRIGLKKNALKSVDRLADESSLTITTGQQLGLLGGPAFTLYKALTCVLLAKRASQKLNVDVIPVFWIADEDHDFEEIRKVLTVSDATIHNFEIKPDRSAKTVADVSIGEEIEQLFEQLQKVHVDDSHGKEVLSQLKQFYAKGDTHLQAFGKQMGWMLAELGMVLVGSNDKAIKELLKAPLAKAITQRASIKAALAAKTNELSLIEYPQQVQIGDSLLFQIDDHTGRSKLDYLPSENLWKDEFTSSYSTEQLLAKVDLKPETFSPNVFLRPVLQDELLPNIGYVSGPGELNYYAQTKELYPIFGLTMPIIYPRLSCTIIKSHLNRKVQQLGWPLHLFKQREEKQAKRLVEQQHSALSEVDFTAVEKHIIEEISELRAKVLSEVPGQTKVYDRIENILNKEFKRLYDKYISELKNTNFISLNRMKAVSNAIFPNQQLQERTLSLVSLLIEYGDKFPRHLLAHFESIEPFGSHLFIEIEQPSTH